VSDNFSKEAWSAGERVVSPKPHVSALIFPEWISASLRFRYLVIRHCRSQSESISPPYIFSIQRKPLVDLILKTLQSHLRYQHFHGDSCDDITLLHQFFKEPRRGLEYSEFPIDRWSKLIFPEEYFSKPYSIWKTLFTSMKPWAIPKWKRKFSRTSDPWYAFCFLLFQELICLLFRS